MGNNSISITMSSLITGLHHVTALTSDAQKNVDFYAGILGLRLVKKTINFDAPDVYHLYYGDEVGNPGSILTFFPFHGMAKGRKGKGQLTVTAFSVPEDSLGYWMNRLNNFRIPFDNPAERFDNETFVYFEDNDGLGIELIANKTDKRKAFTYGQIPIEYAIKGFYSVTLSEDGYERTAGLLTEQMDHKLIAEKGSRFRFSPSGLPGSFVDILCTPEILRGLGGAGTVHHVAFATPDDNTQIKFRERLLNKGLVDPTPVIDRQYFHSVYFREPGGILFEAATSDIGFTLDEPKDELGEKLKLPLWEEMNRSQIEKLLTPLELDVYKFKD
jgi:glyoxalase family protein